jgi:hypothetical protein
VFGSVVVVLHAIETAVAIRVAVEGNGAAVFIVDGLTAVRTVTVVTLSTIAARRQSGTRGEQLIDCGVPFAATVETVCAGPIRTAFMLQARRQTEEPTALPIGAEQACLAVSHFTTISLGFQPRDTRCFRPAEILRIALSRIRARGTRRKRRLAAMLDARLPVTEAGEARATPILRRHTALLRSASRTALIARALTVYPARSGDTSGASEQAST